MKKIINELREKSLKELEKEKVDLYEEIAKYQVEKKLICKKIPMLWLRRKRNWP